QLKAIQKELGEGDDAADEALKELKAKLDALPLPEEARREVSREWSRLGRVGREALEAQGIPTLLRNIAQLPGGHARDEHRGDQEAARILDEDHHGLSEVKVRILEFLAVRQLSEQRAKEELEQGEGEGEPAREGVAEAAREARAGGRGRILLFAGP